MPVCVLQGAMLVDLVNRDLLPTAVWTTVCHSVDYSVLQCAYDHDDSVCLLHQISW